ncbi:hypothetical protein QBC42DRAFT_200766 [Cladorrhinum samala]|uniref:Uncharacterized protein n=1 Tax=Cladorrhinum samala TaxID=585594 RepID=A0AAV9HP95_9PEZI|nr:hypothetical protein QBC42DRAFT_200766 [Cladorrhinum samala]
MAEPNPSEAQPDPDSDDGPQSNPNVKSFVAALVWLSAAQSPLRAHELWMATQFQISGSSEWMMEQLGIQDQHMDDRAAFSALQELLGDLISEHQDGTDPRIIYVEFADPDMRHRVCKPEGGDTQDQTQLLSISVAKSHYLVTVILMGICSATPIHLARIHRDTATTYLILYAWAHWATHFKLSGETLKNETLGPIADYIIKTTCMDVLAFLLALNDFLTGPITLSVIQDQTRCVALVREAQEALEGPAELLSALYNTTEYAKSLEASREIFEASKHSRRGKPNTHVPPPQLRQDKGDATDAGSEAQQSAPAVDRYLFHTLSLFDAKSAQIIRQLVDAARGLRSLCTAIVKSPLYEEFLKEYAEGFSPLDILTKSADMLETLGTYAYWGELPSNSGSSWDEPPTSGKTPSRLGLATTERPKTSDADFLVSNLLRSHNHPHQPLKRDAGADPFLSSPLTALSSIPSAKTTSPLRYRAAEMVYKLRGLSTSSRLGAQFTINPVRPPQLARTSSALSSLPPALTSSSGIGPLPAAFYTKLAPKLARLFFALSPLFAGLDNFSAGMFTAGQPDSWPLIKQSILSRGYRTAFAYFLVAIILHHVRGVLFPWLGQYVWYRPLEDLRLAVTNPDAFVQVMFGFRWKWVLASLAQKLAWDAVNGAAMALMVAWEKDHSLPPRPDGTPTEPAVFKQDAAAWWGKAMDACRVECIVWALALVEFFFSKSVYAFAWLLALAKLAMGGDAEHIVLGNALRDNWLKVPFVLHQTLGFAKGSLWPIAWVSVVCALVGQPGLLLVWSAAVGGVWAIIKHRSTFYMALQLSGMFVAGGLLLITVAMLAVEFWDDPLGVKLSTALARRRADRIRRVLPGDYYQVRTEILEWKKNRSSKAVPVVVGGPPPSASCAGESSGSGSMEEKRD